MNTGASSLVWTGPHPDWLTSHPPSEQAGTLTKRGSSGASPGKPGSSWIMHRFGLQFSRCLLHQSDVQHAMHVRHVTLAALIAAVFDSAPAQQLPEDCSAAGAPTEPLQVSVGGVKFTPKA